MHLPRSIPSSPDNPSLPIPSNALNRSGSSQSWHKCDVPKIATSMPRNCGRKHPKHHPLLHPRVIPSAHLPYLPIKLSKHHRQQRGGEVHATRDTETHLFALPITILAPSHPSLLPSSHTASFHESPPSPPGPVPDSPIQNVHRTIASRRAVTQHHRPDHVVPTPLTVLPITCARRGWSPTPCVGAAAVRQRAGQLMWVGWGA